MIEPIRELARHSQSIWYDGLKRDLLRTGGLARLLARDTRGHDRGGAPRLEGTGETQRLHHAPGHALVGDYTLFLRSAMVDAAWRVATPILDVWASAPARDFPDYPAGSWGPPAADELLRRDGRRWVTG
jgi:glucose-6-phosphate 1-dehydrogenase